MWLKRYGFVYYDSKEIARRYHYEESSVISLAKAGRVNSLRIGDSVFIREKDLHKISLEQLARKTAQKGL